MHRTNHEMPVDSRQAKSDLLSMLEAIDSIYTSCQDVFNTYAQTTLLLSLTIESQTLLTKLRTMKARWRVHLPFKEACDVNFHDWSVKVEKMRRAVAGVDEDGAACDTLPGFTPSKYFTLDFYEALPETAAAPGHTPYYKETDVNRFFSTLDDMSKKVIGQWPSYRVKFSEQSAKAACQSIGGGLSALIESDTAIRKACCKMLQALSAELEQLDDAPSNETSSGQIQPELFARLACRVLRERFHGGQTAQAAARRYAANLRNSTPSGEWDKRRSDEIWKAIDSIDKLEHGRVVDSFLSNGYDFLDNLSGFGQFLYACRKSIGTEELDTLLELLYRIHYLREYDERLRRESAGEGGSAMLEPRRPSLPPFFNKRLIGNVRATEKFYDILHNCGYYMNRTMTKQEKEDSRIGYYANWKWSHVCEALKKLGILIAPPQNHYAKYISMVFPDKQPSAIEKTFRLSRLNMDTYDNIVMQVKEEFMPVVDKMNQGGRQTPPPSELLTSDSRETPRS